MTLFKIVSLVVRDGRLRAAGAGDAEGRPHQAAPEGLRRQGRRRRVQGQGQ